MPTWRMETRIVGIPYKPGSQTRLNGMRDGYVLELRPEPDNEHDPRAIAVVDPRDGFALGYVPRDANTVPNVKLAQGITLRCRVLRWPPAILIWSDVLPSGIGSPADARGNPPAVETHPLGEHVREALQGPMGRVFP